MKFEIFVYKYNMKNVRYMLYTFNSRKDVFFDVFLFDMINWIYIYIYQQRIYYFLFIIGLSFEP